MVEWVAKVDHNGWSAEDAATRRAEAIRRARAAGLYCDTGGDHYLVLRWQAPDDPNAAYRVLADSTGVEPGDFVSGEPARRLIPAA
jgi:hypothetical protein